MIVATGGPAALNAVQHETQICMKLQGPVQSTLSKRCRLLSVALHKSPIKSTDKMIPLKMAEWSQKHVNLLGPLCSLQIHLISKSIQIEILGI